MLFKKIDLKPFLCLFLSFVFIFSCAFSISAAARNENNSGVTVDPAGDPEDDGPYTMAYFADKFGISIEKVKELKSALCAAVDSYQTSFDLSAYEINHDAFLANLYSFGYYI